MSDFVTSNAAWISFWGLVVTVTGFIITLWQLVVVNMKVKKVEKATKTRIENTLNLVVIVEMVNQISSLQDDLRREQWEMSIFKMSTLHVSLSEIAPKKVTKECVRYDFDTCVSKITSDLSVLRDYRNQKPNKNDVRSMLRNLDVLLENLKLIEQKLK